MKQEPSEIKIIDWLDWDSDHFGFHISKLVIPFNRSLKPTTIKDYLYDLKKKQCKLCYIEDHGENAEIIKESIGLSPVAINLTYYRFTSNKYAIDSNIKIIHSESPELYDLAYLAGHKSRYKLDPEFSEYEFKELYRTWIENSLNGEIADFVLGYYSGKELQGFITLKISNNIGTIGLLAVNSSKRGYGIGGKLVHSALSIAYNQNCNIIKVSTQKDNLEGRNFYCKMGFEYQSSVAIYHYWFI